MSRIAPGAYLADYGIDADAASARWVTGGYRGLSRGRWSSRVAALCTGGDTDCPLGILCPVCHPGEEYVLAAAGWGVHPPRDWVEEAGPALLAYATEADPHLGSRGTGSPYRIDPHAVVWAWRAGLRPSMAAAAGAYMHARRCDEHGRHPSIHVGSRLFRRLALARRALGRSSARDDELPPWGILWRCGRLSPEAQRIVLDAWRDGEIARLDASAWGRLAPRIHALRHRRVRVAAASGRRAGALIGLAPDEYSHQAHVAYLTPQYPRVSLAVARTIVNRGMAAAVDEQCRGLALTRREAHEWALAGAPEDVRAWLLRSMVGIDMPAYVPATEDVIRWLGAVHARGDWPLLTRERTIRGPAGDARLTRYVDHVDQIDPGDLVRGTRTGVAAAYRAAAERFGTAMLSRVGRDRRVLCRDHGLAVYPRAMRELRTGADLVAEGEALGHCVGGYWHAVEQGRSIILALRVRGARSTVEVDATTLEIRQHYGRRNGPPTAVLERLLARARARWSMRP